MDGMEAVSEWWGIVTSNFATAFALVVGLVTIYLLPIRNGG